MFAVVANGIQTICKTQRQLDNILALYTYPKFQKFNREEDALKWIRQHSRVSWSNIYKQYGDTSGAGFLEIKYEIQNNTIAYNIDTEQLGYIGAISDDKDVAIRNGRTSIDIIVSNVVLDDLKISSHIIAIRRVLRLLGPYVDIDVLLPDMSVYLAITEYKGKNYIIRGLKQDIASRLGGVSFTVRGEWL